MMNRNQIQNWLNTPDFLGKGKGIVSSVAIDSRQVEKNGLFVPMKGERTDGHNYIEDVLKRGVSVIPVSSDWARHNSALLKKWEKKVFFPIVDDTLQALQDLAKGYLAQFKDLTVIGITGSNGKTTTKEITQAILSRSGASICNEGNLNSDSGLPLSAFRVTKEHRYGIFEMGMNRVGEMSSLARVAKPDLALVTNIGTAHIGMIGSQEGIAKEKKEIFSQFDGSQIAFVNNSDPFAEYLSLDVKGRIVKYGTEATKGYSFTREEGISGQVFNLSGREIQFPLPGSYNVLNALGAVSIARELGFSSEDIVYGLENCTVGFGRSEVLQGKTVTLLRDCYNANGDSMAATLALFENMEKGRRKIVVLGDMGELGDQAQSIHRSTLLKAQGDSVERIFLLGENFESALEGLSGRADFDEKRFCSHKDYDALEKDVVDFVRAGDLILLKGSRSMALERLSDPLLAQ